MNILPSVTLASSTGNAGGRDAGVDAPSTVHLPPVTRKPAENEQKSASQSSARDIADAARATINASGTHIPLVYGHCRFQPRVYVLYVNPANGALLVGLVIAEGEIDAITAVEINNVSLRGGCSWTAYRGLPTQAIDPTIAAAMAAATPSVVYGDALNGVAHVVVSIGAGTYQVNELTGIEVTLRGKRVFDPRDNTQVQNNPSTWKYSVNAALVRADFLTSGQAIARGIRPRYGRNAIVDNASLIAAANWCDTLVGTAPAQQRRGEFNAAFLSPASDESIDQTLRTASGCFAVRLGNTIKLVPDQPRSAVLTFDDNGLGANNIGAFERISERRSDVVPTAIDVTYPDTSKKPWGSRTIRIQSPGVVTGDEPEVVEGMNCFWSRSYGQAFRYGLQRLNTKRLQSRAWAFTMGADGWVVEPGDVGSVTHKIGFTNKLMVVDRVQDKGYGDFVLNVLEYDPAMYANTVITEPTYTGAGNANCDTYPAITALTASQYAQFEATTCVYRAQLIFTVGYYPCLQGYDVELSQGATLIEAVQLGSPSFLSMPLSAGSYTLRARVVSTVPGMAPGPWTSTTLTIAAVSCPPAAPASFRAMSELRVRVHPQSYIDPDTQTYFFVDAPTTPITATEIWFGYSNTSTFATATLMRTQSGAASFFSLWIGKCSSDTNTRDAATLTATSGITIPNFFVDSGFNSIGNQSGSGSYPNAIVSGVPWWQRPHKAWVRFAGTGGVFSEPVEIAFKQAALALAHHEAGFTTTWRTAYCFDGALFAPVSGVTRTYGAGRASAYTDIVAHKGNVTYQYLGGNQHGIDAQLFTPGGDIVSGFAQWSAWHIEPQLGV